MPFTQAHPLSKSLRKALESKTSLLRKRASSEGSQEATYYFNARTPWIRMTSGVDVIDSNRRDDFDVSTANGLAERYVLGTIRQEEGVPAGHTNSARNAEAFLDMGIRPQPGIINLDVKSHNQFGSLRTATVTFQVWSKEDLDACEMLFMRPGMSVLLEWGWSLYVSGTGEEGDPHIVKDMGKGVDLLKMSDKTLIDILRNITELKAKYKHGYDGIFGFVKNFSWSLRADGGYDCSTSIVSPGELVESLNVSYPPTDVDVESYQQYFTEVMSEMIEEARNTGTIKTSQFSYNSLYGGDLLHNYEDTLRAGAFDRAFTFTKGIPKFETETALSTFINFDILYFLSEKFKQEVSGKDTKDGPVMRLYSLSNLHEKALYAKRLSAQYPESPYHNIIAVRWMDPEYEKTSDNKLILEDNGDAPSTAKTVVQGQNQYYIQYGMLLEVMNNFMLQQDALAVSPFSLDRTSTFSELQSKHLSLDPSICMLPTDLSVLKARCGFNELTYGPPPPPESIQQDEEDQVFSMVQPVVQQDEVKSITDIYLNVDMVKSVLSSSQLQKITSNGVPVVRLYDFIDQINSRINEACAGTMELAVQYFDHDGKFAIIDRKSFHVDAGTPYKLDLLGLGSLFTSIQLQSALTPEMSSALAISAQANLTNIDSTSASFMRFNDGIRDRIISNRKLEGAFIKGESEKYTSSDVETSQIYQLYDLIYGQGYWIPESFSYAKQKLTQYNNELYGNTAAEIKGRAVIPFFSTLSIDGTSGFNILNGFRIAGELLPYSYKNIPGGVGMVVTGLGATVDSAGWKSSIKAQFYSLASEGVESNSIVDGVFKKASGIVSEDNYVFTYNNQILESNEDFEPIESFAKNVSGTSFLIVHGQYDRKAQKSLSNLIELHYTQLWGEGTVDEDTEKLSQEQRGSALDKYFSNVGIRSGEWFNELDGKYPWSSVYVTYMITEGYGYKQWIDSKDRASYAAHYIYATDAKKRREGGYSGWTMFSLQERTSKVSIKAEVGDVLIKARAGKRTNSHGVIVWKIEDGKAYLAGGNESDTNKIYNEIALDADETYKNPPTTSGYLLVLKKM